MACDYAHRRDVRRKRRLRCIRPNVWNLCTSRTRRAEYSFSELTPDDRAVLWGFVIMAAKRYGVALAHIVVMSNHLHCLVRAARPKAISLFHGYFKARFAKYINEKHGRTGNIWAGRFHNVNLLDDEAQIGALSYGIDHGMKEDLVARADAWHLPQVLNELCTDGWLRGRFWVSAKADGHWRALSLRLTPLDRWADDSAGYRAFVKRLLEDRVAYHAERRHQEQHRHRAAVAAAKRANRDPATVTLPDGSLHRIIRQHDYIPTRAKRSRARRFKALGPMGHLLVDQAEAAHIEAIETYERVLAQVAGGAFVPVPELPEGYQWPGVLGAAFGEGIIEQTFAEILSGAPRVDPIPDAASG